MQSGVTHFIKASHLPSLPPQPKLVDIRNRTLGRRITNSKSHHIRKSSQLHGHVTMASLSEGVSTTDIYKTLEDTLATKNASGVESELNKLREQGITKLWSSTANLSRRNTFMTELTRLGIKNAEELAIPSTRNDAVFLASVVGVTSVIAVAAGQLPGDWGFFVPYLVGSLSLVVLAVGSVAPGLFQVVIDKFSGTFPDYQERILRHEAAHFLTAYMVGLPIVDYSLDLGKEHVNLLNETIEKKIYEGLDANLLDRLAVVSMAGMYGECYVNAL